MLFRFIELFQLIICISHCHVLLKHTFLTQEYNYPILQIPICTGTNTSLPSFVVKFPSLVSSIKFRLSLLKEPVRSTAHTQYQISESVVCCSHSRASRCDRGLSVSVATSVFVSVFQVLSV